MPRISKALKDDLIKAHANNEIIKRQVKRGINAAKKGISYYAKHPAAVGRDITRAKNFINTVSGRGDYTVPHIGRGLHYKDSGSMIDKARKHTVKHPRVSFEKGEMVISHSEYVGELISGSAATTIQPFTSQVYQINPGNLALFPWLSSLAINFQMYEFVKLIVEYRPLVSDSATTTTSGALTSMGSVIMATQYDSVLGPYINKNTMENSDYSVSCKPSEGCMMAIECQPKFNPLGVLYVNGAVGNTAVALTGSNANPTNTDVRFQDLGLVQISSNLIPTQSGVSIDLGEIWVHYEVKLLKPQLNGGLTNVLTAHYQSRDASVNTSPLGTDMIPTVGNYLTLVNFTSTSFSFPLAITEGNFLVTYQITGSVNAVIAGSAPTVTNGSLLAIFDCVTPGSPPGGASYVQSPINGITSYNFLQQFVVSVNAPGANLCTVTIPAGTFPGGTIYVDLIVTPYNINMM